MKDIIKKIKKRIQSPQKYAESLGVKIGKGCLIADKETFPSEGYLVEIGDNCGLTYGCRIYTHGGGRIMRTDIPDFDVFGKVKIGNSVYLGANSLIMPGVTIEDNVLVAAGSVVTKSIPSGYVVAGNPAKIVCTIDEYKEKNLKYNAKTKGMKHEEKKKHLLSLPDEAFVQKKDLKIPQ